jgi:hypothetical protein
MKKIANKVMRLIIASLMILACSSTSKAQYILPSSFIANAQDGKLQIRWEPLSHEEWFQSLQNGYDLNIYRIDGQSKISVHTAKVKAADINTYEREIAAQGDFLANFYGTSRDVMYPDKAVDFKIDEFMNNVIGNTTAKTDSFKINLLSYYSIYDMKLAQINGLGYTWEIPVEGTYEIELKTGNLHVRSLSFNTIRKNEFQKAQIEAKFGNHEVDLVWEGKNHVAKDFGFFLDKSEDGINFQATTELPYILHIPREVDLDTIQATLEIRDSLVENYKTYYYRLRSIDFFGNYSKPFSSVSGYGFQKMLYSPRLTRADQKADNSAYFEWKVEKIDEPLIHHFTLLRADSLDGIYTPALDSIASTERIASVVMERESNYFRLEAVPKDGEAYSSTPVLVMGIDTVAPAVPILVSATIDTLGRVQLIWNKNEETDLWGYKIFKSNFANAEYSLLNGVPSLDTIAIDSANLDMGIENVYYKLQAVDFRNNRSEFTEPIILERPNIKPPLQAEILDLEQKGDSLLVHWAPSVSKDVVLHRIFRRAIDTEKKWTLIANLDSNTVETPFLDLYLEYDKKYAYTVVAIDDTNLESGPSDLKMVYIERPKENFEAFVEYEAYFDDKLNKVVLEWKCNAPEEIESYLIYRGWTSKGLTRYEYLDPATTKFEDHIEDYQKAYYKIRPIYKTARGNFYSDLLAVVIPSKDK